MAHKSCKCDTNCAHACTYVFIFKSSFYASGKTKHRKSSSITAIYDKKFSAGGAIPPSIICISEYTNAVISEYFKLAENENSIIGAIEARVTVPSCGRRISGIIDSTVATATIKAPVVIFLVFILSTP